MAKREVKFESQDRRIAQINKVLNSYGIASIEEAEAICDAKGIDPYLECEQTQNICFENAKWAYVVGAAIAIKKNCIHAADGCRSYRRRPAGFLYSRIGSRRPQSRPGPR